MTYVKVIKCIILFSIFTISFGIRLRSKQLISSIKKKSLSLIASLCFSSPVYSQDNPYNAFGVDAAGLFHICPSNSIQSSCVSSQDDRPPFFLEPFTYDGSTDKMYNRLLKYLVSIPGATIVSDDTAVNDNSAEKRYIHVQFTNTDKTIDECEFYFTPNDSTIQFRSFRKDGSLDFNQNRKRLQKLGFQLKLESVPVLRNRRRAFLFVESPFDTFGPPTVLFDKLIDDISGDQETVIDSIKKE